MNTKLHIRLFSVWLTFLLVLISANIIRVKIINMNAHAAECYTTTPNANYGFGPTGRPCPNPVVTDKIPFRDPTKDNKGILPNPNNISSTKPIDSALYLATFPLLIFSVIAIIATVLLEIILQYKQRQNTKPLVPRK